MNFRVMDDMTKESPWMSSSIVWALLFPLPLKILGFPLARINFAQYFVPSMLISGLWTFLFTWIGVELRELVFKGFRDLLKKKLKTPQVIEIVLTGLFGLCTVIFFIVLWCVWRNRVKAMTEQKKNNELIHFHQSNI
jgi:hypothetical protein